MPEQLQKIATPIKTKWDALTRDQRIKLVSAVLVVLLAIALTIYLAVRTQYVDFIGNLTTSELMPIQTALNNEGIKSKLSNNGTTIQVDKNKATEAKIAIESSPEVNHIRFTFADALDRNNMSITENTRRSMLIRAKETDIAMALMAFDGVNSASVSLHVPEPVRFLLPDENKATAAALLQVNRQISRDEGMAMARYMMRGVEGLELENIEIIDNQGRTIFSGLSETGDNGFNSANEIKERETQQVTHRVSSLFAPLWDEVRAVVNLEYDNINHSVTESRILEAPAGSEDGFIDQFTGETSQVRGANSPNEPGLGSNDQTPPSYLQGGNNDYSASQKAEAFTRAFNEINTIEQRGPDSYIRDNSSITVFLYRYIDHFEAAYKDSMPGFTPATWLEMKNTARATTITDDDDPNIGFYKQSASNATGIPISRITLIINEVPLFHDDETRPIDPQLIAMLVVLTALMLMLAYGVFRRNKVEEEDEDLEPELSVEDLLVSTQLEEAKEEEAVQLEEINYMKESEVKKQIEKFVNEKPEAVAALLRNWLNAEEW
jgi:flagellar M-ring protein FliF